MYVRRFLAAIVLLLGTIPAVAGFAADGAARIVCAALALGAFGIGVRLWRRPAAAREIAPVAPAERRAAPAGPRAVPASARAGRTATPSAREAGSSWAEAASRPSGEHAAPRRVPSPSPDVVTRPVWFAQGEAAQVGGRIVSGGLIYVGTEPADARHRSTVDPSCPVADNGADYSGASLPYWPSYRDLSPHERLAYLRWLGGPREGGIGLGMAFIYFYGLERRALQDKAAAEFATIRAETLRLIQHFGDNRSFGRYARHLVDTIDGMILARGGTAVVAPWFEAPPEDWDFPLDVRMAIGRRLPATDRLGGEWMFAWFLSHPETKLRTPALRAFGLFRDLFVRRFDAAHPDGLKVARPKRTITIEYQAASSDFATRIETDVLDVAGLKRPLEVATAIADACQEELGPYSRLIGKDPAAAGTIRALALLPRDIAAAAQTPASAELRKNLEVLCAVGPGLASVLDLCALFDIPPGKGPKLPKAAARELAEAALTFGYAVEPDVRTSAHTLSHADPAVVYRSSHVLPVGGSEAYLFAKLETTVGMALALADGTVSAAEVAAVERAIDAKPGLDEAERASLKAFALWLGAVPPSLPKLKATLGALPEAARAQLAQAVVDLAAADGHVAPAEVKLLEQLFAMLGLGREQLYGTLHAAVPAGDGFVTVAPARPEPGYAIPARPAAGVALDPAAIARITAQTRVVSDVLADVFAGDEPAEPEPAPEPEAPTRFEGLHRRHASLLDALTERPEWSREDFDRLARQFDLMPDGAIETLNEWSYDRTGDPLLEGDDPITVARDLEATSEAA